MEMWMDNNSQHGIAFYARLIFTERIQLEFLLNNQPTEIQYAVSSSFV